MQKSLISTLIITSLAAVTLTAPAFADHQYSKHYTNNQAKTDFANVTEVEPLYKTITHRIPERSCWNETRYQPYSNSYRSHTPTVLGTLIGGALGNEVGHNKTNKKVGTVVGAVLGASVARDWQHNAGSNNQRTRAVTEEVCEVNERVEYEERIVGYNVSYRYQGQTYQTQMDHHPGKKLKVAVSVTPVY